MTRSSTAHDEPLSIDECEILGAMLTDQVCLAVIQPPFQICLRMIPTHRDTNNSGYSNDIRYLCPSIIYRLTVPIEHVLEEDIREGRQVQHAV